MDPNTLFYFNLILTGVNLLITMIIAAIVLDIRDDNTYYKRR